MHQCPQQDTCTRLPNAGARCASVLKCAPAARSRCLLLKVAVLLLFAGLIREQGNHLLRFFHRYQSAAWSSVFYAGCIDLIIYDLLASPSIGRLLPALRRRMAALALQCRDKYSSRLVIHAYAVSVCADSCSCSNSTPRRETESRSLRWVRYFGGGCSSRQDLDRSCCTLRLLCCFALLHRQRVDARCLMALVG
jgi:hypothetical protein